MGFSLLEVKRKDTLDYLKRLYKEEGNRYIISFSFINKYGINPRPADSTTPLGVYGYPLNFFFQRYGGDIRKLPYGADRPYILVLKTKPDAKILVVSKITSSDVEKLFQYLYDHANEDLKQELKDPHSFLPYERFFNLLYGYAPIVFAKSSFHIKRNILLRNVLTNLGYDIIIDDGMGLIHDHEPYQAVILNLNKAEHVETLYNPYATIKPEDEKNYRLIYYKGNYSDPINPFVFTVLKNRLNLNDERIRNRLILFLKNLDSSIKMETYRQFLSEIEPIIKKIYDRYNQKNYNPVEAILKYLPNFKTDLTNLAEKYGLGNFFLSNIRFLMHSYFMDKNWKKYVDLFPVDNMDVSHPTFNSSLIDLFASLDRFQLNQLDEKTVTKLATLIHENYERISQHIYVSTIITILKLSKNDMHRDFANLLIKKKAVLESFSIEMIDKLIDVSRSKQITVGRLAAIVDKFRNSPELTKLIDDIRTEYGAENLSDKKQTLQSFIERLQIFIDATTGNIFSRNEKNLLIKTAVKNLYMNLTKGE